MVVAAMRARDPELARTLHIAHRTRTGRELLAILREVISPATART
jgi:hypothetical protein